MKVVEVLERSADALYEGGWRPQDHDELMVEYDLTDAEAEALCEFLGKCQRAGGTA